MTLTNEKKKSVWTRLEIDCDIDELIYGDVPTREPEHEENASDR